jgi:two-component system, chemotaxis family, protein-glutamate methylesterase/glutaminase
MALGWPGVSVFVRRRGDMKAGVEHAMESTPFAVVAIASSAGGIAALQRVLGALPSDFPMPIVVVQHLDPRHETIIAEVIGRWAKLEAALVAAGDRARPATIHIAPPDRHLLVDPDGALTLSSSRLVNFVRPSADLLFESVADSYGSAALACVLTGSGWDGAAGAIAIKSHGGTVIVQDPELAEFSGMPQAAIDAGAADHVVPLEEIAPLMCGLVEVPTS